MSLSAMTWASQQAQCSPMAKFVLIAIANHADEAGECWPSRGMLAAFTNQSVDTISRRLKELEEGGYIERAERHRANGSRTSDHIRLLMGGKMAHPPLQSAEAPSADCGGPLRSAAEAPSALLRSPEPSIEPSVINIPPLPPAGGVACVSSEEIREDGHHLSAGEEGTQLDAFLAGYPMEPEHTRHEAVRAWARLGPEERAKAMLALPRYVDHVRLKKIQIRSPASYLRNRVWEGFAARPAAAVAEAPRVERDPLVLAVQRARGSSEDRADWWFAEDGSPEWVAWSEAFRVAGYSAPGAGWAMAPDGSGGWERRRGRSFPTRFPPAAGSAVPRLEPPA